MTIWKRWIQRSVLCGLVLGGLVAFATTASAADRMPAITDHAGMATWYEKEAASNQEKAKNMAAMKAEYAKSPAFVQSMAGVGGKTNIPQHCEALITSYTNAAEGADQLAKMHRAMMK
jgi:enterochelin esterase-like enzyme